LIAPMHLWDTGRSSQRHGMGSRPSSGEGHSGELLSSEPTPPRPGLKNTALHEGIISGAVALGGGN